MSATPQQDGDCGLCGFAGGLNAADVVTPHDQLCHRCAQHLGVDD